MFIVYTLNDEIVNLAQWEGVRITEGLGKFGVEAFNDYVSGQQPRSILLKVFKNRERALNYIKTLREKIIEEHAGI